MALFVDTSCLQTCTSSRDSVSRQGSCSSKLFGKPAPLDAASYGYKVIVREEVLMSRLQVLLPGASTIDASTW